MLNLLTGQVLLFLHYYHTVFQKGLPVSHERELPSCLPQWLRSYFMKTHTILKC